MVLSNEETLLERIKSLREYDGIAALDPSSFNLKLTDLQAALGLSQLGRFSAFQERRSFLAAAYRNTLSSKTAVCPSAPPAGHMATIDLSSGCRMHRLTLVVLRM